MAFISKETATKIRKEIRAIAKKYGCKLSAKIDNNTKLDVVITEGELDVVADYKISQNQAIENTVRKIAMKSVELDKKAFFEELEKTVSGVMEPEKYFYPYLEFVQILKGDIRVENAKYHFTGEAGKMIAEIEKAIKKFGDWHDDSDVMSDYFDIAFYYNISVGSWDKPYKKIGKKTKVAA